ncbi:ABC transporter permease [Parahaliea maris]|nr:ABC transporter permease [Parahaliea maris]
MALRADASRFYLGYLWWLLEPLLWVGVFYLVFSVILKSRQDDFLIFLMCGKLTFIWFSKAVSQASNSIVASRGLIAKLDIPKSLFPMSVVQESLYKQAAAFILLFVVLVVFGFAPSGTWWWLVPIILVNYLMIVACALVGASLVCIVRDFSMLIPLGMTFLLFTSGIFWNVHDLGDPAKTELVLALNPIAFILDCYRQALMWNTVPDLSHLALVALGAVLLIGGMLALMRRSSQYLALKALTA